MSPPRLYQPSLLRFLHGVNALVVVLALVSSFWVYNLYDGRLIQLPLPQTPDIIGIHGTFGVGLLVVFALYSFHLGQNRLIGANTLHQLQQIDRPSGRYAFLRLVNTIMLLAATFALATGRMMKEEWLPAGNLNEIWYGLHLWAWVVMAIALGLHLFAVWRAGGTVLLRSILSWQTRKNDTPRQWWQQVQSIWKP